MQELEAAGRVRVLQPGRAWAAVMSELPELLRSLRLPDNPLTWIHADLRPEVLGALETLGLHEVALKSLREGPERPRVEEYQGYLYISLFKAVEDGRVEVDGVGHRELEDLRLLLGPTWVISLGEISAAGYATLRDRIEQQVIACSLGTGHLLYQLAEWAVETLYPSLDALDLRVDALEDLVVMEPGEAVAQGLFRLKRDLGDTRRRLTPLRDVLQRLSTHPLVFVPRDAQVYFRDVHDDVLLILEQLDTYRDILSSALDLYLTSVSNRLSEIMKRLAVVATVFMPITFITGFFGMNFEQMPFANDVWFGLMILSVLGSVGGMLIYFRRRRWW